MDVRVGSWNVENLFRPGGQFGPARDAVYERKLTGLAETIGAMAPDVIGLQEVGSPDALADLVAKLDPGWQVVASGQFAAEHPIRVAVLSRHPIAVVEDESVFPADIAPVQATDRGDDGTVRSATRAGRGALGVAVSLPDGRTLRLVCAHLKSKLLSFPAGPGGSKRFAPKDEGERARVSGYALFRRTAEAVGVRGLADRMLAADGADGRTTPVVVLGDLNDEPAAATTQILNGPPGSQLGTGGFDRADQGDATRLWNLAQRIPEPDRFTRRFEGHGELIDHILASHVLLDPLPEVRVVRQAGQAALPSITADPTVRRDQPASDHAAVLATFTF
jgi:endonuclease/exonuclease/phosphatase family metal-dependent hydrolase